MACCSRCFTLCQHGRHAEPSQPVPVHADAHHKDNIKCLQRDERKEKHDSSGEPFRYLLPPPARPSAECWRAALVCRRVCLFTYLVVYRFVYLFFFLFPLLGLGVVDFLLIRVLEWVSAGGLLCCWGIIMIIIFYCNHHHHLYYFCYYCCLLHWSISHALS